MHSNRERNAFNKIYVKRQSGIHKLSFKGDGGVFTILINEKQILNRNYPKFSEVVVTINFDKNTCFIEGSPFGKVDISKAFTIDIVTKNGNYGFFVDVKTTLKYNTNVKKFILKPMTNSISNIYKSLYEFEDRYISTKDETVQAIWLISRIRINLYLQYINKIRNDEIKIQLYNQSFLVPGENNSEKKLDICKLEHSDNLILFHTSYTKDENRYKNTRLNFLTEILDDYKIIAEELNKENVIEGSYSYDELKNNINEQFNKIDIPIEINEKIIELEKEISSYYQQLLPLYILFSSSYRYFTAANIIWEQVFNVIKPKNIYYLASYNRIPFVYTANKMNIKTLEYQYSAMTNLHFAYNMSDKINNTFRPHTFYAWGDYFLNKYNVKNVNKKVLGYDFDVNKLKKNVQKTNTIIIISQPELQDILLNIVKELGKEFIEYKIIIKPHRKELYNLPNCYLEMEKIENVEVIKDPETPFGELISSADFCIGSFSTGIYEAASIGLNVFLIGKENKDYIDETLIKNYSLYIYKSARNVRKIINLDKKTTINLLNNIDESIILENL